MQISLDDPCFTVRHGDHTCHFTDLDAAHMQGEAFEAGFLSIYEYEKERRQEYEKELKRLDERARFRRSFYGERGP